MLLIRQGQTGEALALFHDEAATVKAVAKAEQDAAFWRRFRAGDQPARVESHSP